METKHSGPSISVIIPTFGRPRFLRETLRSIAAQTYQASEVIVVDDCSPVPVEIPSDWELRVRVLRHAVNQGPGAARNTGLSHATGEWVLFLDDDDLLTPERLQRAVEEMGQAKMHAMLVETFDVAGDIRVLPKRFEGDLRGRFLDEEPPFGGQPSMGQVVHRRDTVVQFDPSLRQSEDTDWWYRMEHSAVFAWTDDVGLRIRVHTEERSDRDPLAVYYGRRVVAVRHALTVGTRRRAKTRRPCHTHLPQSATTPTTTASPRPEQDPHEISRLIRRALPLCRVAPEMVPSKVPIPHILNRKRTQFGDQAHPPTADKEARLP